MPNQQLADILTGDEFFRFTFVRNPYSRLVSGYKDKIVRNQGEREQILNFLAEQGKIKREEGDLERPISFEQFVMAVTGVWPRRLDIHWQLQTHLTCARWVKHHFVGKIERFYRDLGALQSITGLPVQDQMVRIAPHKTDTKDTWRNLYTEKLAQQVADYYAADFAAFDYDVDSWRKD